MVTRDIAGVFYKSTKYQISPILMQPISLRIGAIEKKRTPVKEIRLFMQRAESRGQRAESREQRAQGTGHRAKSREHRDSPPSALRSPP